MKTPDVSIVVRTYNRPEHLRECLSCIQAQSYPSLQTIVVNDAGEDVEPIVHEVLQERNHKYICNPQNMGRTAALNIGVENTDGTYICFLDDDDVIYPEHVKTLAETALPSQRPFVYSDVLNVTFEQDKLTHEWKRAQEKLVYSFDFERNNLLLANYIPITCWLVRRDCFDAVGPFDESLLVYEDWEFLIRLSRKFDFYHIRQVTGEYRRHGDNSNLIEQEAYHENERVVKRRYRQERDRIFDGIFKSTFQHQREMRQLQQRFQNLVQQASQMQNQLVESKKTIGKLQKELIAARQEKQG